MDWARGFFAPGAGREPAPEPETLADTPFSEADDRLGELWQAYYESSTGEDAVTRDANFEQLVSEFLERYEHWYPETGVEGRAGGSVTGHPMLVLGALGCNFKAAVHLAWEALRPEYDGTPQALPRPELLHLLAVLSRSSSNRQSMLRWDVHTSAVRLLKALCTHMLALGGNVSRESVWEWKDVEGWWMELEVRLRFVLQMVTNFVDPTVSWLQRYECEVADWSGLHRSEAERVPPPPLTQSESATASVVDGALPALVDGLTALRHIILQAPFCRDRQDLLDVILRLLGAAVYRHKGRQTSTVAERVGPDAVCAVLDNLGWTHHQRFTSPFSADAQRDDLVTCTYSSQLLLLRVLCEILHFHPKSKAVLMRDGRNKIVETMLWVCASFCDSADLCDGEGSASGKKTVADPVILGTGGGFGSPSLPRCEQLQTCLHMLRAICTVSYSSPDNANAVSLFFDLVSQDIDVCEPAAQARHYFLHTCPAMQMYSLQALSQFCADQTAAIEMLRSEELLSKAFGCGFYFPADTASPPSQTQQLQLAVLELVLGMATSQVPESQPTNVHECDLLLKLADTHASTTPSLVADVGRCLTEMLRTAPMVTRQSLAELGAVKHLRSLILQHCSTVDPHTNASDGELARQQVFEVCATYLRENAARLETLCEPGGPGLLDTLFSLLDISDCHSFAVECITACLCARPNSHEGHAAKAALFARLAAQFSTVKSDNPMQLVDLMLKGVSQVVRASSMLHQDMFRDAMCVLHIITFWNTWGYSENAESMSELTVTLVQTLTVLIAGNDESKADFSENITYDQLQDLLQRPGRMSDELFTSLYSMMFDEDGAVDESAKIQNAECVAMYVNLLYTREDSYATTKIEQLIPILQGFSTNIQSCCDAGLLDLLIGKLPNIIGPDLQKASVKLVEVLGGHSITAKQLRKLLGLINRPDSHESGARQSYAPLVLEAMNRMYVEAGAANFYFDFDGKESGLQVSEKVDRWPQRGYSFCAWIKIEAFDNQLPDSLNYEPRLFSFVAKDGHGVEAILRERSVVLQILTERTVDAATMTEADMPLVLDEGQWYHIAIVHRSAARTIGQPEVFFFIDGKQQGPACVLRYPNVAGGMHGYIGTSAVQSVSNDGATPRIIPAMPLCGQMSSLYFFDTAVSHSDVHIIHTLGPNYKCSFEATDDSTTASETGLLTQVQQSILAGGLSAHIWLSYNATACDGSVAFDTTPEAIGRTGELNARLMGSTSASGTRSCVTRRLRDTMTAMGGVKLLFPLFVYVRRLPCDVLQSTNGSKTQAQDFLNSIFILFQRALVNRNNVIFMAQSNGFGVIQHLLRQVPPECFTVDTLQSMSDLSNSMLDTELQALAHRSMLLDFQVWINAEPRVQMEAIRQLHRICQANPSMFQDLCGVQGVLDIVKEHYWSTPDSLIASSTSANAQTATCPKRPSPEAIRTLRRQLLEILQTTMEQQYASTDLQHILTFLCSVEDGEVLCDVVVQLRSLCQEQPEAKAALISLTNLALLIKLFTHDYQAVRCQAMLLFASLVSFEDNVDPDKLPLLREIVLCVDTRAATDDVKHTLLCAALGSIDSQISVTRESDEIKRPVFIHLLFHAHLQSLNGTVGETDGRTAAWSELAVLLEALLSYFSSNVQNCLQFCAVDGWQEVCVPLLTAHDCPTDILDLFCLMFQTVHVHSFRYLTRGWQMMATSLAHIEAAESSDGEWVHLRRRFCTDMLQSVYRVIESGVWRPEMRDSISRITLLAENVLFYQSGSSGAQQNLSAAGTEPDLFDESLAEAAWLLLDREDLQFTDFVDDGDGLASHPGGLARIAIRVVVALIVQSVGSKNAGDHLMRLHKYLYSLPRSTDQTNAIHVYALAKLAQACSDDSFADTGRKLGLARILQQFVRSFEPVLEHSLADPRICRATLADDEFKRANLLKEEYEEYAQTAYVSEEWLAQLGKCECLKAEHRCTFMEAVAFAGFSDEGLAAFRERSREAVLMITSDETARRSSVEHLQQIMCRSNHRAWILVRRSLSHERSPLRHSNDEDDIGQFWKLDKVEGIHRKRMLLRRNYNGSKHEEASRKRRQKGAESVEDDVGPTLAVKLKQNAPAIDDNTADLDDEEDTDVDSLVDVGLPGTETTTEPDQETSVYAISANLIKPLRVIPGQFEITTKHMHFVPDPPPDDPGGTPSDAKHHKERKWPLRQVVRVYPRRYLLLNTAVELFQDNGTNFFLDFKSTSECDTVIKKLLALRQPRMVVVTRRTKARMLKDATNRWKQRQISNFEYIMFLNTISGRSYNDISQYPVFPWVLNDYKSSTIDLNDRSVYRDLSKPVGALNPERLEYLTERYRTMQDPEMAEMMGGGPPYLYGSHYSNPAYTLFYLIRMEPFTKLAIELQNNQFDHADRLFHSISATWSGVCQGHQDFKELIPEFYYLPDFLCNTNGFDLGTTQKGDTLGDVVLPPWAKSAEDFVRINRLALESEFVSQDLHLWIDLVFGTKQADIEAHNVFHPLTYEGSVDIDAIEDDETLKSTQMQIAEMGQTPVQLFKRSHTKRSDTQEDTAGGTTDDLAAYFNADARKNPLVYVHAYADFIVTLSSGRSVGHHRWMPFPNFQGSPFTFELDRNVGSRTRIGVEFARGFDMAQPCFAVSPDGKLLFSCGHWDATFKCSSLEHGRVLQSVGQHKDIVTTLALGEDGSTLVTGSLDGTVMVWEVSSSATPIISRHPRAVLYGHRDEITCTAINTRIGVVASTSKDGSCLIHKAHDGQYIRCIKNPSIGAKGHALDTAGGATQRSAIELNEFQLTKVLISQHGSVVLYSPNDLMIYSFSVNGKFLCQTDAMERLCAWALTMDGECLITGSERKIVRLRCLDDLQVMHTFQATEKPIHSLALTPGENILLVGLDDGRLSMLTCASYPLHAKHATRLTT